MKKLHFFVIVTLVLLGISSRLYSDYPKLPLLERWTGAGCVPCADYNKNQGYSSWIEEHRNEVAIITWHIAAGNWDPIFAMIPEVANWRGILYNSINDSVTGAPEVKWNGRRPEGGNPTTTEFEELLEDALAETTPMKIEPTFSIEGDVATVHVKIHTTQAMDNIKLRIVLVESAVNYAEPPGVNGERVFPHVAKFLVPDSAGTSLTLAADETWEKTFTQSGMTNTERVTHTDRMYAVVFVEEMTMEHNIVQAALSSETVPYPPIYEAKTEMTTGIPYDKIGHEELVTHTFEIDNIDDYEISVTPLRTILYSGQNLPLVNKNWEIVESNLPTQTFTIPAKTKQTYEMSVVHTGDKPAGISIYWQLDCIMSADALAERDGIALNTNLIGGYFDFTEDMRYAVITGAVAGDNYIWGAFADAPQFEGGLIEIPSTYRYMPHPQLFMDDVLDSIKFLGFGTENYTWMADIAYDALNPNRHYKYAMMKKLTSLKNTKIFMSLSPLSYFFLLDPNQFKREGWGTECDYAVKWIKDNFGLIATYPRPMETIWNAPTGDSIRRAIPFMQSLFWGTSQNSVYSKTLFGEEGDSIASANPTIVLNGGIYKNYYIGRIDSLTEYASSVYNYYAPNYHMHKQWYVYPDGKGDSLWFYDEDEKTGKYVWTDSTLKKNLMVKWDNGTVRRVSSAFDFAMIPSPDQIASVAHSIVDWMFAPETSIEDGETNMSTKNGLLLRTYPNPVTSVSDVIVQNTNVLPVSGKVYLLDMSGAHVMDLFNGTLNIGDNNIQLSNSNLTAGKYFVVSETDAGKTFMSVVISK